MRGLQGEGEDGKEAEIVNGENNGARLVVLFRYVPNAYGHVNTKEE